MSALVASFHIFSYHRGELTIYHETWFILLIFVLAGAISDIGSKK